MCIYMCIYVYIYVCIYIYVYIYMYIYILVLCPCVATDNINFILTYMTPTILYRRAAAASLSQGRQMPSPDSLTLSSPCGPAHVETGTADSTPWGAPRAGPGQASLRSCDTLAATLSFAVGEMPCSPMMDSSRAS